MIGRLLQFALVGGVDRDTQRVKEQNRNSARQDIDPSRDEWQWCAGETKMIS